MSPTKRDLVLINKILMMAKASYYNSGKLLRAPVDKLTPFVLNWLRNGSLVKGKPTIAVTTGRHSAKSVEITDDRYDLLEVLLKKYQPDAPVLRQVRSPVSVRQQEVRLPFLMPSLDKKLSGEGTLQKWLAKYPGPYIIMDKLDGISMELSWAEKRFDHLYKGGSATHGMDWSHAISHLRLPKAPAGEGGVRCELIMSKSEFEGKWAGKYKNSRNLTSGIVNKTKGVHEAIGSVEPVVLDVLHKRMKPSAALDWARQQGFKTVHYIKATTITEDKLLRFLKTREKASHLIDGLVIAQDKPFALTEDNPKSVVAFKAPSEGNSAVVEVVRVEWQPSRHGLLKPVIIVKEIGA